MLVSVIVCTYNINRFSDFMDAVNSLLNQSYKDIEIIVVVDGNDELYGEVLRHRNLIGRDVIVLLNETNLGLSKSRNRGIEASSGDVIAFFDDDAVANEDWIKELVRMYDEYDAIAAGGKLIPMWVDGKMDFLPEEYYWLIGATHKGFSSGVAEVRNTFGSNISFKSDVLKSLGGFRGEMGIKGSGVLQGEETEMCVRMRQKFGKGVMYNPDAIVHHKIFTERTKVKFLLKRAFWQGYSKRMMEELGHSMTVESDFIKSLANGIYVRVKAMTKFKLVPAVQIFFLILLTFMVFMGYVYKIMKFEHSQ